MDSRIDLTADRDFRHRRVSPSVPRSIFNKDSEAQTMFTMTNGLVATGQIGAWTSTNAAWMSIDGGNNLMSINATGTMTSSTITNLPGYYHTRDGGCSYCGKDISRIPWHKEAYLGLCKECSLKRNKEVRKVPWK